MARISTNQTSLLPHNAEAERSLVASILLDPDAMMRAKEKGLEPEDFMDRRLAYVYDAALTLTRRLEPIERLALAEVLSAEKDGQQGQTRLDAIGGENALTDMLSFDGSTVYAGHYAEMIVRAARRRRLISVAGDIARLAQEHEGPLEDLYNRASRCFLGAVDVSRAHSHLYGSDEELENYLVRQQDRAARLARNPSAAIETGLHDLDSMLGDLPAGCLHVVVARPSVGKTMYMERVAEENAKRGHKVAFYHLELSHDMMCDRAVARHSGVTISALRRGDISRPVHSAMDEIRPWFANVVYVHCPGWSAERIAADIQRLVIEGSCEVAIVDYLQKIALPNRAGLNAAMLYGQIAETLKTVAEVCGIPLVLGSQVSRDFKARDDKRPRMEDIRNSGEIEEKANQIVVLHRPEARTASALQTEPILAFVEKNTMGDTGECELVHVLGRFLLASVAREKTSPAE